MKSGERALTGEQVELLLSSIGYIRDKAIIELAITGGIRREDLVSIYRAAVNFDEQSVTFHEGKKGKQHKIYLSRSVMNTLSMQIKAQPHPEWLFPSMKKDSQSHISGVTAWRILDMYLKKNGLKPRPFHALRATCIKLCQAKGWTPEQTARHVNDAISTIQNHYLTPSPEEMRETAQKKAII